MRSLFSFRLYLNSDNEPEVVVYRPDPKYPADRPKSILQAMWERQDLNVERVGDGAYWHE